MWLHTETGVKFLSSKRLSLLNNIRIHTSKYSWTVSLKPLRDINHRCWHPPLPHRGQI